MVRYGGRKDESATNAASGLTVRLLSPFMSISDTNPDSIFGEVIEGASGVCQNCYRRTHDVETDWWPQNRPWEPIVLDSLKDERWFSEKEYTQRTPNVFRPAAHFPAMKRACKCGMIDTYSRERPLKKQNTIDYTHHIAERLEEKDIPFNKDILFDKVREMKENPDEQYSDERIFEEAVEEAVNIGVVEYRRKKNSDGRSEGTNR